MKLEDVFEQTHRLPTIPKIVQELIDSFNNDSIDIQQIAQKITLDQVITAKVLRLANSAHFGASRRIGTVQEAVVVLGFNTVRTLVIASGITGAFIATPGFDRREFWRRSLLIATNARWLARRAGVSPDMAFTCGMLHNIGEMLIHIVSPDFAQRLDRWLAQNDEQQAANRDDAPGFDYVTAGVELVKRWNFPGLIVEALRHQSSPASQVPPEALTAVLNLAIRLENLLAQDKANAEQLAGLPASVLQQAKLQADALLPHWDELLEQRQSVDELVG